MQSQLAQRMFQIPEASSAFWAEITGDHEDQIYIHVGRLVDGKFDLAGPNN